MATTKYEGRTGGLSSTTSEAKRNDGWFSKLVDPAAQLIVRSASRLFPSVFGKKISNTEKISQVKSSKKLREQGDNFVDIKLSFHYDGNDITEQELNLRLDAIFQLEQLIYQKRLSKVEIDILEMLLHSRMIESSDQAVNHEEKKKANSSELDGQKENLINLHENVSYGVRKGSDSPIKISRAYFGPKPRKGARSTLGLYSRDNCMTLKPQGIHYYRSVMKTNPLKRCSSNRDAGCFGDARRRVRRKCCSQDVNGLDHLSHSTPSTNLIYAPPLRSVEMARKILLELDKQ